MTGSSDRFFIPEIPSFGSESTRNTDLRALARSWESMRIKFLGLKDTTIRGRLVSRTPSASNDVVATDREGDVAFSATYMYVLINNAGTLAWRRVALSSW
jgi:hypothetical protein